MIAARYAVAATLLLIGCAAADDGATPPADEALAEEDAAVDVPAGETATDGPDLHEARDEAPPSAQDGADVLHAFDPTATLPSAWPHGVLPIPEDAQLTRTVETGDGVTLNVEFASPTTPEEMDRLYLGAIEAAEGWEISTHLPGRPMTIMADGPGGLGARVEVHSSSFGDDVRGTPFTAFPDGSWVAIVVEDRP